MLAADRGHVMIVGRLLIAGADVNARNSRRESALLLAAAQGHRPVVLALLEAGADPGFRNERRQDARQLAVAGGYGGVIELLDSHRASRTRFLGLF